MTASEFRPTPDQTLNTRFTRGASHRLHTGFTRVPHRLHAGFTPASRRLSSDRVAGPDLLGLKEIFVLTLRYKRKLLNVCKALDLASNGALVSALVFPVSFRLSVQLCLSNPINLCA